MSIGLALVASWQIRAFGLVAVPESGDSVTVAHFLVDLDATADVALEVAAGRASEGGPDLHRVDDLAVVGAGSVGR